MANEPNPAGTTARDAQFAQLVADHARLMYRVAHGLLRHPQDAEDAVQDALLKLYRTVELDEMDDPAAFLARTVWRTAWDRRERRLTLHADAESELRMPDSRANPEAATAEADERALLHELIDALPEELRQPLLLSAVQELNSREIARVIEIPEGTVRTRLMRARAELRRQFAVRNQSRPGDAAAARRSR